MYRFSKMKLYEGNPHYYLHLNLFLQGSHFLSCQFIWCPIYHAVTNHSNCLINLGPWKTHPLEHFGCMAIGLRKSWLTPIARSNFLYSYFVSHSTCSYVNVISGRGYVIVHQIYLQNAFHTSLLCKYPFKISLTHLSNLPLSSSLNILHWAVWGSEYPHHFLALIGLQSKVYFCANLVISKVGILPILPLESNKPPMALWGFASSSSYF